MVLPMSVRPVKILGSPVLRTKAAPVKNPSSPDLKSLIRDLIDTMNAHDGIGIAAPQIGVSERVIVINAEKQPLVFINPHLAGRSLRKEEAEEGCLSIPGVFGLVKRNKQVTIVGFDGLGRPLTVKASGLLARVCQHEIDHINGILFIDRTKKITRGKGLLEARH